MRQITLVFSFITMALSLTNCNTMEGMGKDIKKGGQKIENTAAENK